MNNQSPLIPQGSLLEQRNKGRARVKIAVFLVLAIHGLGLMALLMQGCKKEPDTATNTVAAPEATNNPAPAFPEPTNTPAATTSLAASPTNMPSVPPTVEPSQPPPTPSAATSPSDYVIVKGDTFSSVAKKFHVSIKSLLEANPSVEPTKLKIGQPIHIPAATVSPSSTIASATGDSTGTGQTYKVQSGDSLTKIAGQFGVSVKSLRSANNLKTDKIVVGQQLKIPVKSTTPPTTTTASVPTSASAPVNAPSGQ